MDAMQDTFVRLLRYIHRLTEAAPSSLLYRIATNVCLNQLRSERRRPQSSDKEALLSIACFDRHEELSAQVGLSVSGVRKRLRALGELPEQQAQGLLQDPYVRSRMEELQISNQEILQAYPPEAMAQRIRWRLEKTHKERKALLLPRLVPAAGFAALLVVAGLLLVTLYPSVRRPGETQEITRLKGMKPHLMIYRKTPAGAEALAENSLVRPGEVL